MGRDKVLPMVLKNCSDKLARSMVPSEWGLVITFGSRSLCLGDAKTLTSFFKKSTQSHLQLYSTFCILPYFTIKIEV
ncbi:hypothetical protein BpHYR1_040541 [Brachionus plicatilis]|uniref:Uncharacterized protein n=1 Tax=Brachionus plicatilis TaxID=10195 RepID=A0A3M7P7V8_BRAPC|nr:hypothetical protein BpHYR1_040541 [Brachionus plicatilis]